MGYELKNYIFIKNTTGYELKNYIFIKNTMGYELKNYTGLLGYLP